MLKLFPVLHSKSKIWGNRRGICRFNDGNGDFCHLYASFSRWRRHGPELRAIGLCKPDL